MSDAAVTTAGRSGHCWCTTFRRLRRLRVLRSGSRWVAPPLVPTSVGHSGGAGGSALHALWHGIIRDSVLLHFTACRTVALAEPEPRQAHTVKKGLFVHPHTIFKNNRRSARTPPKSRSLQSRSPLSGSPWPPSPPTRTTSTCSKVRARPSPPAARSAVSWRLLPPAARSAPFSSATPRPY